MSVAIVHDYFTQRGGAERLVDELARHFPDATIHAAVSDPEVLPPTVARRGVKTTPLQQLWQNGVPLRALAPVLPAAFRVMHVGTPEVVISSSSAFAHHVRPPGDAVHVVYCHTPPRFLWHTVDYFGDGLQKRAANRPLEALRRLDRAAARRAHTYIANSASTAEEIRRVYDRDATVIHPPIDTRAFSRTTDRSDRYLVVSRLKPHKRLDLAIEAANLLGVQLDVIGEGPDMPRLKRLAGPTVTFLGRVPDAAVRWAMARCEALVVPGREDFGMTTAEIQAAGRPPVAFAEGGALEIIDDGATGFLFHEQTPEAVAEAMIRAIEEPQDAAALVASARRFDHTVFDAAMTDLVDRLAGRIPAVA